MNPILQKLTPNNNINQILQLKQMMQNSRPELLFQMMLKNNPQFASFVQQNNGRTVDQIASAYGIDMKQLNNILK